MDNCFEQFRVTDLYDAQLKGTPNVKEYEVSVNGLSMASMAGNIGYHNISSLPAFKALVGGALQPRQDSFSLMGEALVAAGRPVLYSVCPLVAGCSERSADPNKDIAR